MQFVVLFDEQIIGSFTYLFEAYTIYSAQRPHLNRNALLVRGLASESIYSAVRANALPIIGRKRTN